MGCTDRRVMFSSFRITGWHPCLGDRHAAAVKGDMLIQLEMVRAGAKQNFFAMREKFHWGIHQDTQWLTRGLFIRLFTPLT